MKILVNGETTREFELFLADDSPISLYAVDYHVFIDIYELKGQNILLQVEQTPGGNPDVLDSVTQTDEIKDREQFYSEKLRPQFHFSARRGWINDPNGLVFYKGEYHLFFQHNPYGCQHGNTHWGHAVSHDLIHWTELQPALYPKCYGDWVFSGSAAVDWHNTGRFKTDDEHVLVAAYTSTGRGECIAYSNNRGRTWRQFDKNPVLVHKGRDPRFFWHQPIQQWGMAVYDEIDHKPTIAFYSSNDLKNWNYHSRMEGFYEFPELFELMVDNNPGNQKWVLMAADGDYAVGTFDGFQFIKESGKHRGNYGNCFCASQTWSDIPQTDGRRIQIAWAKIDMPAMPFNQMMTFPCSLHLVTTADGVRLAYRPVREIEAIYKERYCWESQSLEPGKNLLTDISGELFDIAVELEPGTARQFGFNIRNIPIICNWEKKQLSCLDCTASLNTIDGTIRIRILVDRTSIEIFGNDGIVYMPIGTILPHNNRSLSIFTAGGYVSIRHLEVRTLNSIWP
ncbi:MAG: glycoside hydrolase family 32 protein [Sedimentisphaerales bacterium]